MRARRLVVGTLCGAILCFWCGWASGFHHSTSAAFATWGVSLVGVVMIDVLFWQGRHHRRPALLLAPAGGPWPWPGHGGGRRALLGASPWLAIIVVVLVWEVLGIDTGAHDPHLTISALAQAFRPLHAALLLVWILVGIGYGAARARAPVTEASGGREPGAAARLAGAGGMQSVVIGGHYYPLAPALLLPQSRAVGVAFWIAVIVAFGLVDLVARRSGGRLATAEEFVRLVSGPPLANVALMAAWTFGGWHLFAH
jgi:hypothetical protein